MTTLMQTHAPVRWHLPVLRLGHLRAAVVLELTEQPAYRRPQPRPDATVEAMEAWRRRAIDLRLGAGV